MFGTTPHLKTDKNEIRAFFEATADKDARISYIKSVFNNDFTEVILSDGRRVGYKTYENGLLLWKGSYSISLGTDNIGNITRLDNALEGLPKRLEMNEQELDNLKNQFEAAKEDVERPFPQEEELKTKTERLNELNALLNVDKRENEIVGDEPDEGDAPPEKKPRELER